MNTPIDWEQIAKSIGIENRQGAGSDDAKKALEQIIGINALRSAVDYYVTCQPYSELVRHVLWFLHPESAMNRCYEIYKTSDNIEHRRSAVELLRVVSDYRGVKWVREFLDDPDRDIQNWGVGMLRQLLLGGGLDPEHESVPELLAYCKTHKNDHVRDWYQHIKKYLESQGVDVEPKNEPY